jgi:hypothetical protein
MKTNEIIRRPPPPEGMAQFELVFEDDAGNVLGREFQEIPSLIHHKPAARLGDMPIIPFLGPVGGALIFIPTVGHNKFALDISAMTGWELALGIGTSAELAADTTLSSEITTYGGARASVTPTVLNNVVTWMHKWTLTTGASFTVSEFGVFKDTILMMRHLISTGGRKLLVSTQHATATITDTL